MWIKQLNNSEIIIWTKITNIFLTFCREPFKTQWLLRIPVGLTLKNSTICPHSVLMYCIRISEQTTIISLYNLNLLIFTTETESVYCAVRTGCLNKIQVRLKSLQRLSVYMYLSWEHLSGSVVPAPALPRASNLTKRRPHVRGIVACVNRHSFDTNGNEDDSR